MCARACARSRASVCTYSVCVCVRERETGQTETETDRQRQTDRNRDIDRKRGTEIKPYTEKYTQQAASLSTEIFHFIIKMRTPLPPTDMYFTRHIQHLSHIIIKILHLYSLITKINSFFCFFCLLYRTLAFSIIFSQDMDTFLQQSSKLCLLLNLSRTPFI